MYRLNTLSEMDSGDLVIHFLEPSSVEMSKRESPERKKLKSFIRFFPRVILKKKSNNGDVWTPVLGTGPKGGSNVALLDLEVGDKVAVFLEGGALEMDPPEKPVNSFSGFRIAKK